MAKFKLFLLTPTLEKKNNIYSTNFLRTLINSFSTDDNEYQKYYYTFDENLKLHKNGQKEFNFSMLKNVWFNDEYITNPFVHNIHNGTQLLLVDKYNNEMLLTVNSIDYDLKKDNITYKYSCQDSFTYQTIRQNAGYTINNDIDDIDFIGAHNVDWWVINKIYPECHIGYDYIDLTTGLFLDNNNNVKTFSNDNELENVNKIIKPIFDKKRDKELFESIPFSISGSNTSATLIALAESIGLSLRTCEHAKYINGNATNEYIKYFWFEPEKNILTNNNLYYSPYKDIQNFNFSHKGDALTTVLNVESNTIKDEVVTLIPEVPAFFINFFTSNEWDSSSYSASLFSSICKNRILRSQRPAYNVDFWLETAEERKNRLNLKDEEPLKENYLYIYNDTDYKMTLSKYYSKILFSFNEEKSYVEDANNKFTDYNSKWTLEIQDPEKKDIWYSFEEGWEIPDKLLAVALDMRIKIEADNELNSISNASIIINHYRDVDEEEIQFAKIADQCPWLENKLIDFSYFYNQNIINKSEYHALLNILTNDLRIINGKLLLATKIYYDALKERTKLLADIENTTEIISAAFHADVVDKYAKTGKIDNINYFNNSYNHELELFSSSVNPKKVLNYNKILDNYTNKFFNANQRFLKNIYNFRNFFNSKVTFGNTNSAVTDYIFQLKNTNMGNNTISFSTGKLETIKDNFNLYNADTGKPFVNIYTSDGKETVTIINKENADNFYRKKKDSTNAKLTEGTFSPKLQYYRLLVRVPKKVEDHITKLANSITVYRNVDTLPEDATLGKILQKFITDEEYGYYCSVVPDGDPNNPLREIKKEDKIVYFDGSTQVPCSLYYMPISRSTIINEYIYKEAYLYKNKNLPKDFPYQKKSLDLRKVTDWDQTNIDVLFKKYLANNILLSSFSEKEINSEEFPYKIIKNFSKNKEVDEEELRDACRNFYIQHFPVSTVYYRGGKFIQSPYRFFAQTATSKIALSGNYQRVNENGETMTDYYNYLKNPDNSSEVKNPFEYEEFFPIKVVSINNESNFYRRVIKNTGGSNYSNNSGDIIKNTDSFSSSSQDLFGTIWNKSGINIADFYGKEFEDASYEGYNDIKNTIVYATTPDAYDNYNKIWEERFLNDYFDNLKVPDKSDKKILITREEGFTTGTQSFSLYDDSNCEDSKILATCKNATPSNEYFNLYNSVGLTYSQCDKLYYDQKWYRLVDPKEKIIKGANYKMLLLKKIRTHYNHRINQRNKNDKDSFTATACFNLKDPAEINKLPGFVDNRINGIILYPLVNAMEELKIVSDDETISQALNATFVESEDMNRFIFTTTQEKNCRGESDSCTIKYFVFIEDNYAYDTLVEFTRWSDILSNRNQLIKDTVVDKNNHIPVDFLSKTDLVDGFYILSVDKSELEDISALPESEKFSLQDETYEYYLKDDLTKKVPTIKEIKAAGYYKYFEPGVYKQTELTEDKQNFKIKIFLREHKGQSFNVIEYPEYVDFKVSDQSTILSINYNGKLYQTEYTTTVIKGPKINSLTNGQFWFLYHNSFDIPVLQQKAILIETELTRYWLEAAAASKYCEYFLPDHWQFVQDNKDNYFASNLFNIKDENISLSDYYIPNVDIYNKDGITNLPFYRLTSIQPSLEEQSTQKSKVNDLSIKKGKELLQNPAYVNAFRSIKENLNNWFLIPNGNKAFYYVSDDSGVKWTDILNRISPIQDEYSLFNGLYIMNLNILKKYFINEDNIEKQYQDILEKHNKVWNYLYKNYPNLILENTYKNEDATNSEELLKMAKYYFKDLSEPERNYNITVIDTSQLENYKGEELYIGNAIKLNAEELYDEFDDVKETLKKSLFITDISYNLRKDNDMQLTVNAVKYQDKLIQRLVRLMK